jgi:hypothetical protein
VAARLSIACPIVTAENHHTALRIRYQLRMPAMRMATQIDAAASGMNGSYSSMLPKNSWATGARAIESTTATHAAAVSMTTIQPAKWRRCTSIGIPGRNRTSAASVPRISSKGTNVTSRST